MDNEDEDEEEGIYFDWVDISELCVVYVIVLFFFFFSFFLYANFFSGGGAFGFVRTFRFQIRVCFLLCWSMVVRTGYMW